MPSRQVLNKTAVYNPCNAEMGQDTTCSSPCSLLHCSIKLVGSFPAEGTTLSPTERRGIRWHQARRRIWRSGCGAGSTSLMLKDREKDDQLASVCRWGESCCPLFAKGAENNTCSCVSVEGEVPRSLPHLFLFLTLLWHPRKSEYW